jgi:hypothetical protein
MSREAMVAPREAGWRGPILSLVALMLIPVPIIPYVALVVPIEHAIVLLIPSIAACAVAAWWYGGRAALALLWIALAAWTLSRPTTGASPGFDALARGWSLVIAAGFGAIICFAPIRTFFARAVAAVLGTLVLAVTIFNFTDGGGLRETVRHELSQRSARAVDFFEAGMASSPWVTRLVTGDTASAALTSTLEASLEQTANAATMVFPALLALETILVLALAWTLFHRLSRVRIGAPLARLRDFRFNDQLIWGVLLGITAVVLPTLDVFRPAGWNLLVFFGGLFAVRGLGVVTTFVGPGWVSFAVIVLLVFKSALLGVFAFVGIGDTWLDWRRRTGPSA